MFYCFFTEYGWPTLENWVKNIKVIDILEQAGTSSMETKMFLDATKDGPHMSIFIKQAYLSNNRFKDGWTEQIYIEHPTPIQHGSMHLLILLYFLI